MTKLLCLVSHIFFSFNLQVYIRASEKVGFQLPKNKGEITTLCKHIGCQVVIYSQNEVCELKSLFLNPLCLYVDVYS